MEPAVNIQAGCDKVARLTSDDNPVIAFSGIRARQRPCDRRFVHRLAREPGKIDNRRGSKLKVKLLSRSREERCGGGSKLVDVWPERELVRCLVLGVRQ